MLGHSCIRDSLAVCRHGEASVAYPPRPHTRSMVFARVYYLRKNGNLDSGQMERTMMRLHIYALIVTIGTLT